MYIDWQGCICETCSHDGSCEWQDQIVALQKVAMAMKPADINDLTTIIRVSECSRYEGWDDG